MSSEQLIDEVDGYNHRTCPIEGDLVEVAVDIGLPKFLDHLLDNMGEELMQKHMMTAVHARKTKMVKCLQNRGLSVNEYYQGVNYLGHTASAGAVPMTRCLLKLGAEVDAKDTSGCTPLINCVKYAPLKFLIPTMRLLFKNGADERTLDENEDDIETCLLHRGGEYVEGLQVLRRVQRWRECKNFKETCVSFYNFSEFTERKKVDKKKKKSKKRNGASSSQTFLELHPDVLSEVLSFV